VAATGFNREKDRLRATEVGFDFYLVKPFDPDLVNSLVTRRAALAPA
jgi:CheY-like chemotaxis protein